MHGFSLPWLKCQHKLLLSLFISNFVCFFFMTNGSFTEKPSFLYCYPGQAVDQTVEFLVIWDTMTLMWCQYYMIEEMYSVIGDSGVKLKWQSGQRFNVMANYISCNFKHWLVYHRMMDQNIACMWGTKSSPLSSQMIFSVMHFVQLFPMPAFLFLMAQWLVPTDMNRKNIMRHIVKPLT